MAESHVMAALKARRAVVSGEIMAIERRVGDLRTALVHLDGAMRLFAGDGFNPEAIRPKEPRAVPASLPALPRGAMIRLVLDTLRNGEGGMMAAEVVASVGPGLGIDQANRKEWLRLKDRVENCLYRQRDRGTVTALRDGGRVVWRVAA